MTRSLLLLISALVLISSLSVAADEPEARRITVLYDAFGPASALTKDWGYSALVEYGGKRILFDAGNNADILKHNVEQLGIDLSTLDAVVISHRHGDHTTGLSYILKVNPDVKIYVPQEGAFFKSQIPPAFLKPSPGLPDDMHYFDGKPPEHIITGTPWEKGNFRVITQPTEIFPGIYVISTQSDKPGTIEMNEASLVIRTPKGLAVVVGCSHPGVEKILTAAARIDPHLYTVTGGFHLVGTPQQEVERVAEILRDSLKVDRVAPGHCTSELGFAVFLNRFKDHFDRAGLGEVIHLP